MPTIVKTDFFPRTGKWAGILGDGYLLTEYASVPQVPVQSFQAIAFDPQRIETKRPNRSCSSLPFLQTLQFT